MTSSSKTNAELHDRPVPRYTSYPTAAQFDTSVGPAQHGKWLRDLDSAYAALYLHIPFCQQLCWYCACHTMAMQRKGTLEAYADGLCRELDLLALTAPGLVVDAIQWGGGTPTQLGAARLAAVGRRIEVLFDRRANLEISLEVDPRYCDAAIAEAIAVLGTTRVSLGVQDFDIDVQKAINRPQTFEMTVAAIGCLRTAGIKNFNIDLVYGLPRQTLETLSRTLDQALALEPGRFAVFGYAHVPWMKPHQRLIDADSLPDGTVRAAMAAMVRERLVGGGYVAVGLDHYAKMGDALARAATSGKLHRNFQGYVTNESPWVAGVGASAISCLPKGYSQNATETTKYMSAIESGSFATVRGVAVSVEDRLRREIIGDLMCRYAADIDESCRRYRMETEALLGTVDGLASLVRDGLVTMNEGLLVVTERGRPLIRYVCAAFDRHYTGGEGKHSRGI
ncbi:MAG: oxygen-independent coproporphyrinogen III oxidase [Reyranella sp.]|nr:oxygen-independent coproporphyrinogen III oxidase [Reyranella sp.]